MDRRTEEGVTLIELLIAITLVGVVVPAIAMTFIVGFRTFAETGDRVSESSNAEIATAYWGADVMNATAVAPNASLGCDLPEAAEPIVSFATPEGRVTWYLSASPSLVRRECDAAAGPDDTTISGTLSPSSDPGASCSPDCTGTITLTVPQAGLGGVGEFVTSLTATRRNSDA